MDIVGKILLYRFEAVQFQHAFVPRYALLIISCSLNVIGSFSFLFDTFMATTKSFCSIRYYCLPFMSFSALPPYNFITVS